jgi:hypothetical protein
MEYASDIKESVDLLILSLDAHLFSRRTDFESLKKVIKLIRYEREVFGLIMICRQALSIPKMNTNKWKKEIIKESWEVIDELTLRLKRDDKERAENMTLFKKTYDHVLKETDVSSQELTTYLSSIIDYTIEEANIVTAISDTSLEDSLLKNIPNQRNRKYSINKREKEKEEYYSNKEQCVIS